MTVREYVGARYVPVFMGDWDVNVDYEPLSIVQYQGNSYTSRQAVPHGVDITDMVYWALTGNYNAQVEAYRQEALAYNNRITALENDLPLADFDDENTVSTAIANLQNQIGMGYSAGNTVASDIAARALPFDTVSSMASSTRLYDGAVCSTNGFHVAGDGGAAFYKITDTGMANGMDVITCGNLFANLIENGVCFNPMQYGAYGDGTNDDSDYVEHAVNKAITVNGSVVLTNEHLVNEVAIVKTTELRQPTYIIGMGGGFKVAAGNTGIKFTNSITSDIYFENVKFNGTSTSVAVDCANLYRAYFIACEFNTFSKCLYTNGLMQSYRIGECVFNAIEDYCIECDNVYDMKVYNNIAETSHNAMFLKAARGNTCVFSGNCIEGFTNHAPIQITGNALKNVFENNYFELNTQGDIILGSATAYECAGNTVCGNRSNGVTSTTVAMVKLGCTFDCSCNAIFNNVCDGNVCVDLSDMTAPNLKWILYFGNKVATSDKYSIGGYTLINPFKDRQVFRSPGKYSYEFVDAYHKRIAVNASTSTANGNATLFTVNPPASGYWYAVIHANGIVGGVGSYYADIMVGQDGVVTPIHQSRTVDTLFEVSGNSVIVKPASSGLETSFKCSIDIYGEVQSVTFDGVTF